MTSAATTGMARDYAAAGCPPHRQQHGQTSNYTHRASLKNMLVIMRPPISASKQEITRRRATKPRLYGSANSARITPYQLAGLLLVTVMAGGMPHPRFVTLNTGAMRFVQYSN